MRIGEHIFHQTIAAAAFRICKTIKQAIALRVFNLVIQVTFFFVAERFAVADEKLEVARVRLIDMRIIDFIYDPVTQREPGAATGVICRTDTFFRARTPSRLNPRRTKRH